MADYYWAPGTLEGYVVTQLTAFTWVIEEIKVNLNGGGPVLVEVVGLRPVIVKHDGGQWRCGVVAWNVGLYTKRTGLARRSQIELF